MSELRRIRELVAQKLGVSERELVDELPLAALEWDSLDMLELIVAVEEEFDIALDDGLLGRCETVGEVAVLVAAALRG